MLFEKLTQVFNPSNFINPKGPFPRDEGTPKTIHNKSTIRQENFLLHLNLSWKIETIVSISEIEDVSAAKRTRMKNATPTIEPPFMDSNTLGSVTNIRPGP